MSWRVDYQLKIDECCERRFVRTIKAKALSESVERLQRKLYLAKERLAKEQTLITILDRKISEKVSAFRVNGGCCKVPTQEELTERIMGGKK